MPKSLYRKPGRRATKKGLKGARRDAFGNGTMSKIKKKRRKK